jgi:hypothetical protein
LAWRVALHFPLLADLTSGIAVGTVLGLGAGLLAGVSLVAVVVLYWRRPRDGTGGRQTGIAGSGGLAFGIEPGQQRLESELELLAGIRERWSKPTPTRCSTGHRPRR